MAVGVGVGGSVAVRLGVEVAVPVCVAVGVGVALCVAVRMGVELAIGDGVVVSVGVREGNGGVAVEVLVTMGVGTTMRRLRALEPGVGVSRWA